MAERMHFRILGPLWVADGVLELTPTAPKVRQVLAFLLVRSGKLVQVDELIDELWGDEPPSSAMTTLQTYIYKLRKELLERCTSAQLQTRVSGYLLDVSAERGDILRFERLAHEGRTALEEGDPARAAERLTEALALWRGPALTDVAVGEILSAHVTRLEEERLRTLELRITADLELGRHQQLVSELKMLVSEHPLNERFHAHLMMALHQSGRRYEALEAYRRLRRMLVDELGMEPSTSVQQLHQNLLSSDVAEKNATVRTAVSASSTVAPSTTPDSPSGPAPGRFETLLVPAQLPPDIYDFVGRKSVLERVHQYLVRPDEESTAVRAVCISGMPGVGKTALALRAGHAERAEFPDGQLYADLRGTSKHPADPYRVLEDFARAIGIPPSEIPESIQERSKLFRTWCMGRRVLVVLDNAHSPAQVKPLLPASPNCAVIVTSRSGLYSLPGVRHLELEEMDEDEAVRLLVTVSGRGHSGPMVREAEQAARLCAGLPLALRCVGSRLAGMRSWPIAKLVARLQDPRGRLDVLSFADLDVRSRLETAYWALDPPARSIFRLISLLPPPDFSATTAALLAGNETDEVETQLLRLADCHLLAMTDGVGDGEIRYRMHELVRIYARERLDLEFLEPVPGGVARDEPGTGHRGGKDLGHRGKDLGHRGTDLGRRQKDLGYLKEDPGNTGGALEHRGDGHERSESDLLRATPECADPREPIPLPSIGA
ncbi:AfsR/SARP family transcriptional regulator [Actinomadura alba]|uniref:Winged helix-turn-helix domain-containing protein n=2 Tax=Actinomadura alba TaxID=406431 RepID=A0ABR7LU60_9ACTN|nr:AfsR/SARP family transcriptional regulator [Actinomadura alba]MBC6468383.1 winged helix-turn-helix domain-containing protein [Actinomadura alba]